MILFSPTNAEENPRYIFIHDDATLDVKMNVLGHYYWWLICNEGCNGDMDGPEKNEQAKKKIWNVAALEGSKQTV